jgi:hypothetical protein
MRLYSFSGDLFRPRLGFERKRIETQFLARGAPWHGDFPRDDYVMMRAETGSATLRVTQMDFDQGSPEAGLATWTDGRGATAAPQGKNRTEMLTSLAMERVA